jgi:hypothetical protein
MKITVVKGNASLHRLRVGPNCFFDKKDRKKRKKKEKKKEKLQV